MAASDDPREVREERRVITAVFADLVGSTTLGERLDPEELKLIVGDAVARVIDAVESFGGTIKDLAGDGVLALFGAPTAHEDDPERAVRASLRIVEEIARLRPGGRGRLGRRRVRRAGRRPDRPRRSGGHRRGGPRRVRGARRRREHRRPSAIGGRAGRGAGRRGNAAPGRAHVRLGRTDGARAQGEVRTGRGARRAGRDGCPRGDAGAGGRRGAPDRPRARARRGASGGRGSARRYRRHPVPHGGARHRQDAAGRRAARPVRGRNAATRSRIVAGGSMRVLRRDHAVLAVPRPAAQLDRGPRRRTRAPRPRRAPADGRAAVRSPSRRALPVPRGAPRPHARAGGREAPGRALTGGAPVPDVRGRSRGHRPTRRRRVRWPSCWRISTGRMPRRSSCSSGSSATRRAPRSCWC